MRINKIVRGYILNVIMILFVCLLAIFFLFKEKSLNSGSNTQNDRVFIYSDNPAGSYNTLSTNIGLNRYSGSFQLEDLRQNERDTVNVKDFGAMGDGKSDDTKAFQLAVSNLNGQSKVLYVPNGEYVLSDKIEILKNNIKVQGDRNTILQFTGRNCDLNNRAYCYCNLGLHIGKNLSNVSISGLKIYGDLTEKIVSYALTVWDMSSNITVEDCKMQGFTGGILFNRKNDKLTCRNNEFSNMIFVPAVKAGGYGIVFQASTNTSTTGNKFNSSIYRHAVYYARNQSFLDENGKDHKFSNNIVYGSVQDSYQTGYELSFKIMGNSNIVVDNNKFVGGVGHVWIVSNEQGANKESKNIQIVRNTFTNIKNNEKSKVYAIGVDGNSYVENLEIKNNIFIDNNVDNLIKLQHGKNVWILNNNVENIVYGHFINIDYGIENLVIRNNKVDKMNSEFDGIYIGSLNKNLKYWTTAIIEKNFIRTALFSIFSNNLVDGKINSNEFYSNNTAVYFSKGNFNGEISDNKFFLGKRGIYNESRKRVEPYTRNYFNNEQMWY